MVGSWLRTRYLLTHPSVEPYYDGGMVALINWVIGGFLVLTAVLTVIGLRLRRREERLHDLRRHVATEHLLEKRAELLHVRRLLAGPRQQEGEDHERDGGERHRPDHG